MCFIFLIFILFYFYYLNLPIDNFFYKDFFKNFFFKIIYIDYFKIFYSTEVTDLNIMRDTYFLLNSFEFFIVNFSLLYGLLTAILAYFLINRIFNYLNFSYFYNINFFNKIDTNFFIRNQNFVSQQNLQPIVRI